MGYLFGIIVTLVGALLYSNGKRKSAEASLENQDTKSKALDLDKVLSKNEGLLDAEEQKRKELENVKKDSSDTPDFFNKR